MPLGALQVAHAQLYVRIKSSSGMSMCMPTNSYVELLPGMESASVSAASSNRAWYSPTAALPCGPLPSLTPTFFVSPLILSGRPVGIIFLLGEPHSQEVRDTIRSGSAG